MASFRAMRVSERAQELITVAICSKTESEHQVKAMHTSAPVSYAKAGREDRQFYALGLSNSAASARRKWKRSSQVRNLQETAIVSYLSADR